MYSMALSAVSKATGETGVGESMAMFPSNEQYDEDAFVQEEEYDDGFDDMNEEEQEGETDPEEKLERKKERFRLAVGAGNLVAVIGGTVAILILLALLFSMVNFVINDMGRSFSLFQTNF